MGRRSRPQEVSRQYLAWRAHRRPSTPEGQSPKMRCSHRSCPPCSRPTTTPQKARNFIQATGRGACCDAAFYSVFTAPLMFIAANPNCNEINAQAWVCQPHTAHSALLIRKTQNPALRRFSCFEATSHEAASVTTMAGHCNKFKKSKITPIPQNLGDLNSGDIKSGSHTADQATAGVH